MSTSPTSQESPETLANAPFDDKRADLILQTSDGVDFRVFKIILSLASPIFVDMFSVPQPTSAQDHDGPQVVTVSEDSKVLDLCLRHLYPVLSPTTVGLCDARMLAEFARKYEVVALESVIVRHLTAAIDIEGDPVGIYAVAITYGHKDIAAKAARSSLRLPISRLRSPHLQCITAEIYGELIQYHAACGEAASAVASERKWFPPWEQWGRLIWTSTSNRGGSSNLSCSDCAALDFVSKVPGAGSVQGGSFAPFSIQASKRQTRFGPRCLWNYLHHSASVLVHHPTAKAVTTEDSVLKFFDCSNCPPGTRGDLLEFSRIFATEIKKAIGRVSVLAVVPCWRCSVIRAHNL
jgi:BTB/POZ domain